MLSFPGLAGLRQDKLLRELVVHQGDDLTSNDVLGLSEHPAIAAALIEALESGAAVGSTGSRLLSGHCQAFDALESAVAAWQHTEAALFFSTGYAANVGLLSSVLEPGHVVISDRLNHASLIDGIRLGKAERIIVPHLSLEAIEQALQQARGKTCWVVVESVYSMDGDRAPLAELARLARSSGVRLIVDEAHATGLFGATGAGRIEEEGVRKQVFASVHTCSKALGQAGAFVCGSHELKQWLINKARSFIYSTAPPPYLAAGLQQAMSIVQSQPELRARPQALAQQLRQALAGQVDTGSSTTHIVPVLIGDEERTLAIAQALTRRGWQVRAIRPPTVPAGQCRLRLVMRAVLSPADVDRLASDLLEVIPS